MSERTQSTAKLTCSMIAVLCLCLNVYGQPCQPCLGAAGRQPNVAPLYFIREFPILMKATLFLGDELGGGDVVVEGSGNMTFSFEPTSDPGILALGLEHIEVALSPFELPRTPDPNAGVGEIGLGSEDFALDDFYGVLDTTTGEVSLRVVFTLDPDKIPRLQDWGILAPLQVVAVERGIMDVEEGRLETHAEPFDLGRGGIRLLTVFGGQHSSCGTDIHKFCVSTSKAPLSSGLFDCPSEAWICPGDSAILYWDVSDDVSSAEITPDVGSVSLWAGQVSVSPSVDTKYKLVAKGDCERQRSVTVRVIAPGRPRQLSATPNRETGVWSVKVSPQTTSPSIEITSIKTVPCGFGAGVVSPWICQKTDPDGFVRVFNVFAQATSPAAMPLVGLWEFIPDVPGTYVPNANACFEVTMRCRE